jgi:hypothetical protein
MFFNLPQDAFLFTAPLTTFLLIKLPGNLTVQFIKIDRIETFLELVILALQVSQSFNAVTLLGFIATLQCSFDPFEDFLVQLDCFDGVSELLRDVFFSGIFL